MSIPTSIAVDEIEYNGTSVPVGGTRVISTENQDGTQNLAITDPVSGGTVFALQNKTVTSNGTVTADSGYDGLGTVTVNVAGPSLPSADVSIYYEAEYHFSISAVLSDGTDYYRECESGETIEDEISVYSKSLIIIDHDGAGVDVSGDFRDILYDSGYRYIIADAGGSVRIENE